MKIHHALVGENSKTDRGHYHINQNCFLVFWTCDASKKRKHNDNKELIKNWTLCEGLDKWQSYQNHKATNNK